jgi:diguanylate cyclase (GGDEF)-like protein/PAS domain S-box-containing protein
VESTPDTPPELAAFDALPDLVVAFDDTLTIKYVNPFARRLLGHEDTPLANQSLVGFLHPDDLGRAAEVAGLIAEDRLGTDTTPALYRLQTADGAWLPVEMNGTPQFDDGPLAGLIVIVGRYSGDNVIQDRILEMLTAGTPIDEIVPIIPEFGLWRHPEAQYAAVYIDGTGQVAHVGSDGALDLMKRFPGDDTPWGRARAQGQESRQGWSELPRDLQAAAAALGMRGCMVLPVRDHLHDELALVIGWSAKPEQDVGAHRYALERMARGLDIIMQWRSHITGLERAAQIDALSGVANRATFFRRFEHSLVNAGQAGTRAAVLYVDLDGFKQVNDTAGHAVGDAVIAGAAERMTATVRRSDLVARLGGDEFAVLCPRIDDVEEVTAIADRLVAVLAEPFAALGDSVRVGASVGIAITDVGETDHDAVLAAADRALYEAKAAGRGCWRLA